MVMSCIPELIQAVESLGGRFMVDGGRLGIVPATAATPLMEELRQHKAELLAELARRRNSFADVQMPSVSPCAPDVSCPPDMPAGVLLLSWNPKAAPVQLERWSTASDTDRFICSTLRQLEAQLAGQSWKAGNWGLHGLLERLAAVGCVVALENPRRALQ
jgi:hypothetical protein